MLKPHLRKKKHQKLWMVAKSPVGNGGFYIPNFFPFFHRVSTTVVRDFAITQRHLTCSDKASLSFLSSRTCCLGAGRIGDVWSWGKPCDWMVIMLLELGLPIYIYIQSVYIIIIIYIIYTPNGSWMFLVVFQCCFSRCCSGKPDLQMVNSTSTGAG